MELSEQSLKITRAELAGLCQHASTDQTRPHLASVCIDLALGRVASTDGHRLLVWTSEKCGERKILLPAHGLRSILAMRDAKKARPLRRNGISPKPAKPTLEFVFGAEETRVQVAGLSVILPHVSAQFPPIEQVIPKYKEGAPCSCVAVNPSMFADLARLAKIASERLPSIIVQPGPRVLDPVVVRFVGDPKWLAVLMPMRQDGTYDAIPSGKAA